MTAVVQAAGAARLSVIATTVVVIVKLIAAWASGAVSVWGEALQSLADIAIAVLLLWSIRVSAEPPDAEHPYGHGKAEVLAAGFQRLLVLATAIWITVLAVGRIVEPRPIDWSWGAVGMAYAVASNVAVAWRLRRVAASTGSEALRSEALHLDSDTLASIGVLAGMLLVGATGHLLWDPIVGIALMLVVVIRAIRNLHRVTHSLMEGALPAHEVEALERVLRRHPSVRGHHELRTRRVGPSRVVDVHVLLDDELTFVEAHRLAEEIESELAQALGGARVNVHYEPHHEELAHRAREHAEPDQSL